VLTASGGLGLTLWSCDVTFMPVLGRRTSRVGYFPICSHRSYPRLQYSPDAQDGTYGASRRGGLTRLPRGPIPCVRHVASW
jgi:hypothetical protein